jgi:regulator of protease activity HflC (stomatin/prohibitin superfamily)
MSLLDETLNKGRALGQVPQVPKGKLVFVLVVIVLVVGALIAGSQLVSNVEKGTYEVRQSWITGQVSAKMTPGWWVKLGTITPWPKAETFYFTRGQDSKFDWKEDHSVIVQFNEGSECNVSGTCRVTLPRTEQEAVALTVDYGYRTWEDLMYKLVQPQVRKALILTANQMTARESYSDRRADFIFLTADQLLNGLYAYDEVEKDVEDPVTGKKVRRLVKVIKKGPDGKALRDSHPFHPLGVVVDNLEIRGWHYSDKVRAQIEKQQQAYMDIQTAIANAQKAEQDKLTAEAEGKAKVAKARYEQEMVKVQEIVKGQKDKEVAELRAQQELEVAKLMALAADQKRLALIRESQGEAEGKRLKREADNYEALKIQAAVDIHKAWAGAYSNRRVPLVMGAEDARSGEGGSGIPAQKGVIDLLILKALGLNINLDQRSVDRPAAAPSTHAPAATPPPQPAASRPR